MTPCNLVATITAIACQISEGRDNDDLAIIATIFSQLGDTLDTIIVQREVCEHRERKSFEK